MHEFPASVRVRAHAITADFRSKLIRNQQVLGSSPSAGSNRIDDLQRRIEMLPSHWQADNKHGRRTNILHIASEPVVHQEEQRRRDRLSSTGPSRDGSIIVPASGPQHSSRREAAAGRNPSSEQTRLSESREGSCRLAEFGQTSAAGYTEDNNDRVIGVGPGSQHGSATRCRCSRSARGSKYRFSSTC